MSCVALFPYPLSFGSPAPDVPFGTSWWLVNLTRKSHGAILSEDRMIVAWVILKQYWHVTEPVKIDRMCKRIIDQDGSRLLTISLIRWSLVKFYTGHYTVLDLVWFACVHVAFTLFSQTLLTADSFKVLLGLRRCLRVLYLVFSAAWTRIWQVIFVMNLSY